MDLKQKLSRLTSAGPGSRPPRPPAPDEPPPPPLAAAVRTDGERLARVERLRGMLSKLIAEDRRKMRERAPAPSAPVALPGSLEQTPYGPLHRVESWLEPAHCHGKVPIARALEVSAETIAKLALDGALGAIDPRRMLFVDTETTGLAGGTGTIPFLIGIAFFEDQSLCIEQLVLRAPGEEAPMLRRLAERLASASCLVTFNGKSYDWPLLRNRFVLNRVAVTPPPAHLDLLHCARRIWKRRLGQVRLVHLEAEVLGMRREHDIDGAEIPQRFWDFVRGAGGSVLAPVIEHNANDLVALAAILVKLADLYVVLRPEHDPADHLGVARVAVRADDHERARLYAEAAAGGGGPADVTVDALWLAAELARKREDDTARIAHLSRALEEEVDEERRARTHLALSKLYEHRVKDYALALEHARCTAAAEGRAARDHRVARIEAKLAKSRRQGGLDLS
jgi:uncharacterized protein YprB with RNaseH-like and TPR domain